MSFIKNPRYNKGKWRQIFVESDGTNYTLKSNDIVTEISSNKIKLAKDFHVTDFGYDYTFNTPTSAGSVENGLYLYKDGTLSIEIASADKFTSLCVSVFGYFS